MEFNENIRRSSRNKISIEPTELQSIKSSVVISNDSQEIQSVGGTVVEDGNYKNYVKNKANKTRNTNNWNPFTKSVHSNIRTMQSIEDNNTEFKIEISKDNDIKKEINNEDNNNPETYVNNIELEKNITNIKKEIFNNDKHHILDQQDLVKPDESGRKIGKDSNKLYEEQNLILNAELHSKLYDTTNYLENVDFNIKTENFDITSNEEDNNLQSPLGLIEGAEECDIENLSTEAIHESESDDSHEFISNYNAEPIENIYEETSLNYEESNIMNNSKFHKIDENIRMIIFGDTECVTNLNKNILNRDNNIKSKETNYSESYFNANKIKREENDDEDKKLPTLKMEICETLLNIRLDTAVETNGENSRILQGIEKNRSMTKNKNEIENSSEHLPQQKTILLEEHILKSGQIEKKIKDEMEENKKTNDVVFVNELDDQNKLGEKYYNEQSITLEELKKNAIEGQEFQNGSSMEVECQKEILKEKIIKSADIYISVEKKLTLHCKLCLERFNDLKLYKKHIYNMHETNKTEASDITETRFKFLSRSYNMLDYNDDSNIILNDNLFKMPIGEIIWEAHLDKFKYHCSTCNNNYDEFDDLLTHENCVKHYEQMHEEVNSMKLNIKMEVDEEPLQVQSNEKIVLQKVYANDGGKDDERWDKLSFSNIMELINKHIGIPDISLENDDILKVEPRDDRKIPNDKSIDPDYLDNDDRKSIFPCQLCGKLYTCRTILREHVRIHTGDNIYQCDVCNKGFLRPKYLDAHKILFHSNPDDTDIPDSSIIRDNISKDTKSYQCRYCERSLTNKAIFEDHLKVHYGVEPFRCQFCKLIFIRKRIQASHEFQIHDDKFLKCSICSRQFDNLTNFQEHKTTHKIIKPEQLYCTYCNEEFPTKQKLSYHIKVHEAGNRFKCSECDKICGNQYMLDQHLRKHNKMQVGTNKLIKCEDCVEIFENYKELRLHQKKVHNLSDESDKNSFKCKYCSLSFRGVRQLSYHERLHQSGHNLECEQCKTCFGNKSALQQHLLTHGIVSSNDKSSKDEFKCKYCGLKFQTLKKVNYHELRHKVGDKFECKYCAKHFTSANALDQHCRKHLNNVQAFVCSQCPAKFSLKETRDSHETFHIIKSKIWKKRDNKKTNAFECNYCVKCFATDKCLEKHIERFHVDLDTYKFKCTFDNCAKRFEKDRKRLFHERIHLAGEKFKCNLCSKLCYDENTLKQHLRRHGQESDFKCKFCPATFNFKHTRTLHEKFKHSSTIKLKYKRSFKLKFKTLSKIDHSVIFNCEECEKSFSSSIILKHHKIKFHEGGKYFQCCSKIFKSKLKLKRHQRIHLDKNAFKCKNCLKSFQTKLFLKLHNKRKHSVVINNNLEKCNLCNLLFDHNEFRRHNNTVHSADKISPYKCLNCDKKFHNFGLLRVHRLTHINLFKCDFCVSGFRQEALLRQHMVSHHIEKKAKQKLSSNDSQTPPPKIIFTCPICQKKFHSFQWKLLAHMEKKHQQQIFRCQEKDYCRRSFLTEAELIEHKKSHLGARVEISSDDQKPFKCNICDRRFIYEAFMKSHMDKFHFSLTPKCKNCYKKFDNEADFLEHKPLCVQNREFKPFQCPHCAEKQFSLENVLNSHLHRAHNVELYRCYYCRQNYLKPEALEDHIKNHHIDDFIIKNSSDPKPFKCEFENCSHRFISSVFLNNHLSKVHNVTIYRCEHCKKGYREEKYFNEHKLTHIITFRNGDAASKSSINIPADSTKDLTKKEFLNEEKSDIDKPRKEINEENEIIEDNEIKAENEIKTKIIQSIDTPKKIIDKKSEDESQVLEELFSAVVGDFDYKENDLEATSILKTLLRATDENEPSTSQYVPDSLPVRAVNKSVSLVDSLRTYRKKPSNDQNATNEVTRERKQSLEELRPYKCKECDRSFVLDIYLLNHVTKVHGSDALANLDFSEVRQTAANSNVTELNDSNSLENKLTPEQLKQFECDQCGKLFSHYNLLKVHKKLHAVKQFKCNNCPAEFASQEKYNEHEDLHKLEIEGKPISKCENCRKIFPNNTKLRIHEKSHSIERPFSCDLCPLTFKTKGHFFDHKRSHTGEKPFECRYCSERFPRSNYRLKHEHKHPEFYGTKQIKNSIIE